MKEEIIVFRYPEILHLQINSGGKAKIKILWQRFRSILLSDALRRR